MNVITSFPLGLLETFVQIGNAMPDGVEAGDLVSKCDKATLADLGLVTPKYGSRFRLTADGERVWGEVRRIIGYTNPWTVAVSE